jgi:hypothetical protein
VEPGMSVERNEYTKERQFFDGYGRKLTVIKHVRQRLENNQVINQVVTRREVTGDEFSEKELRQAAEYLQYLLAQHPRQYDEEYNWVRELNFTGEPT